MGPANPGREVLESSVMPSRWFVRFCAGVAAAALCLALVTPLAGRAHCRDDGATGAPSHPQHDSPPPAGPGAPHGMPDGECSHCPPLQCATQAACVALLLAALPEAVLEGGPAPQAQPAPRRAAPHTTRSTQPPTQPPLR